MKKSNTNKTVNMIGLDLAKNVFQVHGVDETGTVVLRKQLRRSGVLKYFAQLSPCLIGVEACGGAHYWSRELSKLGHDVRMMAPAFVKPYLRRTKMIAMMPKPSVKRCSVPRCDLYRPRRRNSSRCCTCIMGAGYWCNSVLH